MVDFADLHGKARAEREWAQTEIGKAFVRFENAHSRYWQNDGNDRISDRRLRELHEAAEAARCKFLILVRGW